MLDAHDMQSENTAMEKIEEAEQQLYGLVNRG